jgi:hypothetical protein
MRLLISYLKALSMLFLTGSSSFRSVGRKPHCIGVRTHGTAKKQNPTATTLWGLLVHRKVAEAHTLTPPSKPIIFLKNRGFWGIFALFFNFAQNSF